MTQISTSSGRSSAMSTRLSYAKATQARVSYQKVRNLAGLVAA